MKESAELRKSIRGIKTRIWYRLVETKLNKNSAYQLEVFFEEKPLKRDADGKLFINGKWAKYRSGAVSPSHLQVIKVNEQVAGSAHLFRHVLWDVLNYFKFRYGQIQIFLNRLSPEVKKVVFKKTVSPVGIEYIRKPLTRAHLIMLERISNLDALACITILLVEAFYEENEEFSSAIARAVQRILTALCSTELYSHVKVQLFRIYEIYLLPLMNIPVKGTT